MAGRKRTAHLWRLSLTITVFVMLAFGSFWLVEVVNHHGQQMQADSHRDEPDYIIHNFSMVRLSKTGRPSYIVSGDKLTHHPADDSADIDKPIVRGLEGDTPPMHIHAERAHADQNNSRIKLMDNVHVEREGSATAQPLQLKTQALTVFPDDETMETDLPVVLTVGGSVASGVGMKANNTTRQIHMGGRGQLDLPPRAAAKPAAPPH
ncbi:LPS export ABC transporter periplasmic protein LptC [Rugamonas sp.]|uniref:LPS export ABC transporter periplasmic protein LptC n=1 Tax=Rugamonas sp. TaxID=1926287 RepID=UPI0025DE0A97|nr:LPS export ABC transporter periplasmic protein LptC [Rugamonas sp.]